MEEVTVKLSTGNRLTIPKTICEQLNLENIDIPFEQNNSMLNGKQKFRKWVLENMPFECFLIVEFIFDIRRNFLLKRKKG